MGKTSWFVKVCERAVRVMIFVLLLFLVWKSAQCTYRLDYNYKSDVCYRYGIHPVKQILYAAITLAGLFLCGKIGLLGAEGRERKRVQILVILDLILTGGILFYYTAATHIPAYWDQAQVFYCAQDFLRGNYEAMTGLYLRIYTHQYGLIFLEDLVLRIWNSYYALQYCNVVFVLLIIYFLYRISDELFGKALINLYCLFGSTFFLPMHILVNYLYGEICSTAMLIITIWAHIRYVKTGKYRYLGVMAFSSAVAVLAKKNALITFIAILIVGVLLTISRKNLRMLLGGLAALLSAFIALKGVNLYYECISGNEIRQSLPVTSWIAMGLKFDGYYGVGLYDGSNESIWSLAGGDQDELNRMINQNLSERIEELKQDKDYAKWFLEYKILEQWNEPTFSSINETGKGIEEKEGLVAWIYSDEISDNIYRFMTHHLFLIYLGTLFYAIMALVRKPNDTDLVIPIAIIGGFLLSIVWEAKGKYIISYVIYMIPYMAGGLYAVQEKGEALFRKVFKKTKTQ